MDRRFNRLRILAYAGYCDNIRFKSDGPGGDCFSIRDAQGRTILAVTLDGAGKCTVRCEGGWEEYDLISGKKWADRADVQETGTAATKAPRMMKEYEAAWSEWKRAAPFGEKKARATAVQRMCDCLKNRNPELALEGLGLTTLPDHLPPSIAILDISNNNLARLPSLPLELQKLWAQNNKLTSLPSPLSHLRKLCIAYNQLTSLPENIADYPHHTKITLSGNPLSECTRRALYNISCDWGYSGPRISFCPEDPSAILPPRALHLAVADWLVPATEGEPVPADRWQAFETEQDAPAFSRFLDKLGESIHSERDPGFKAQISSWLTQLAEDGALRAKTFDMAEAVTSTCADRITLALNQMRNVQLIHDVEKGNFNNHLPELVSRGREMFRLDKLEQIARNKVATQRIAREELEVYLGYQNGLKRALELTCVAKDMRYFTTSRITNADLWIAECHVKKAENREFGEWILEWEPLQAVLQKIAPERWEAAYEERSSAYDDSYERHTKDMTKEELGNTELCCKMGKMAIEESNTVFLNSLRPLVQEVLGEHLEWRWRV